MTIKGLKIPALILFVLLHLISFSQAFSDIEWYDVDSLLNVLPDQTKKKKTHTLNALAASLSFEDKEQCRNYANQALSLAEKLKDQEGIAAAYRNFGRMEFYDGNYPDALKYYQKSHDIYESQGNAYLVAHVLEDIGTTHFFARNIDKAFEYVQQALVIYRRDSGNGKTVGGVKDTSSLFVRISLPYRVIGRSDIARDYYLNYIAAGKQHHFDNTSMIVMTGLLAACYFELGNWDSCAYYFRLADQFPEENMSIQALKHEHMRRLGLYALRNGKVDSFFSYYLENVFPFVDFPIEKSKIDTSLLLLTTSYEYMSENGFLKQAQMAARQIGDVYVYLNDQEKAEIYYLKSVALINEILSRKSFYRYDSLKYVVSWGRELYLPFTTKFVMESTLEEAVILYEHLYKKYVRHNQLRPALKYLLARSDAKDSLFVLQRNRESIEIQTRYESARKDDAIESLSQQNELIELQLAQNQWILVSLGGLVILIILLAMILTRQNKIRNSQQILMFQQRLLRTQMNPHFLFNSLASIQNFIIKEKPALASDYLSRFSKLVRQILKNSVEEYVPLEDEISSIENYLELQKVRHRDMFEYTIDVDDAIDLETTLVPPMLAQPFVENSIEHGFKLKEGKGHVRICIEMKGKMIRCEMEDDGIGRDEAMQIQQSQNKDHRSMSTDITLQRISALNKKLKRKITLDIIDLTDAYGKAIGTKVVFEIPLYK